MLCERKIYIDGSEARHARRVGQITKYKVDTLKSKHNYILYSIVNNYMFRPLKRPFAGTM